MKITSSEGVNLINLQYGVCFGVIFASFFYLNPPPPKFHVSFAVSSWVFIMLCFYYFFDWLTANLLREKLASLWYVLGWSIFTWFLGLIIIMTNSLGILKYFLLSSYTIITAIYNLFILKFRITTSGILWKFGASITGLLGLYLLLQAVVAFKLTAITQNYLESILPWFIPALLFTKIIRFVDLYTMPEDKNE